MVDLTKLQTEQRNTNTFHLDQMNALEIATAMNHEDENVILAVKKELPKIAIAIEWCSEALSQGGRIIYMGAGTSGRLGLLDAVECPPTFGVSHEVVVGLIAGGENAFIKAVEGAEDSTTMPIEDLKQISVSSKDIVIGIAASGRTPYVIAGLEYANSIGCKTISIANNPNSLMAEVAQLAIDPVTGPEVLTGSTRLKAGSSQKMVLNMISTGSMVLNGKVYQNLMVDVMQTNKKLITRAENIVMNATDCTREVAQMKLEEADGSVKLAITMILLNVSKEEAEERLQESKGHIRLCLQRKEEVHNE